MLNADQFRLRAKLEKNIDKASLLLNHYAEKASTTKKKNASINKELRDRLYKCHIRVAPDDLNNQVILNEINRTLAIASSWLRSSNYQTLRRKSKTEQPESPLYSSGDASGMYAFSFWTAMNTSNERLLPLFQNADQCENELLKMTPISKKFYFSDRNEATQFKDTVLRFGLHFVIEHDYERYFLNRRDETTSQSMTVLIFHVIPLGSYKLFRSKLLLNETSLTKVRGIDSIERAQEFLDKFGSHVALDRNQLGGILCQSIEITASQALSIAVLERYADEIISDKFTDLKFQPHGLTEILMNSEEEMQVECRYCADTLGPLVAQPGLFERLLEANPLNLQTIDRDFSSLVGVWEIVEERYPTLKSQADQLRRAWLEKAGQGFVVEREIKKVQATLQMGVSKELQSAINGRNIDSHRNSPIYASVRRKNLQIPTQIISPNSESEEDLDVRTVFPKTPLQKPEPTRQISPAFYKRRRSSAVTVEVHQAIIEVEEHMDNPEEDLTETNKSTQNALVLAAHRAISTTQILNAKDETEEAVEQQPPFSQISRSDSKELMIVNDMIEPIYAEIVSISESESQEESINQQPEDAPLTPTKEHIDILNEYQRINNETISPASSTKKPYNYFIADSPVALIDPELRLLMAIRRREKVSVDRKREKSPGVVSAYSSLLKILSEFDVPSIRECFTMLLETNHLIPLFNPLTQESYLDVIKDINLRIDSTFFNLGSNKNLSRVAVISSRKETQVPELIDSLFGVQTFHQMTNSTSCKLSIDFGVGHLKGDGSSKNQQHVLVSYVVGEFKDSIHFIQDFADYLIVEDTLEDETSIYHWVQRCWKGKQKRNASPFADIPHVTFWTPSETELRWTAPKDNFHIYGPDPLLVEAPLNKDLTSLLVRTLKTTLSKDIEEKSYKPASNRKCLREVTIVRDSLPLRMLDTEILNCYLKRVNVRQNLPLQRISRRELKRQSRGDPVFYLKQLDEELLSNVTVSVNIPLVDIYLKSLQIKDTSQRVFVLRLIEEVLYLRTEEELHLLDEEITLLFKSYLDSLCSVNKPTDTAFALKKYIEAKENYRHAALYAGHIWREISLVYFIKPYAFTHLPALGAQHLLDGFKLELLHSNSVNLNWIHAVLFEVGKKIQKENQRFFVLSCIGQQDSNKSSFLAKLFGLPNRIDGREHYTSGVYLQIIPVVNRNEYDYVLLLDAEDTWPPTRYEVIQALHLNYQIAAMCSLISDATIIVNPKEDEILDVEVLSTMAAIKVEPLEVKSSKKCSFFSVFDWIGASLNSEKLKLRERFEASDQQNSLNYEVDGIGKFREIIHQRVTGPQWVSRDLSAIEKQLKITWTYATSVDFKNLCQEATREVIQSNQTNLSQRIEY